MTEAIAENVAAIGRRGAKRFFRCGNIDFFTACAQAIGIGR